MKIRQLWFILLALFAVSGHSFAGELFVSKNINLYTREVLQLSLRDVLRLEDDSATITSIFVLSSTDQSHGYFRLLLNEELFYEHAVGPNLRMVRVDGHFSLEEVDSLLVEFGVGIHALTVGVILDTGEEGNRAITIGEDEDDIPDNDSPEDGLEKFPEQELDFLISELRRANWDQRRLDVLWHYRHTTQGRYLSMEQMARILRTFYEDAFRIEGLRIFLYFLEKDRERMQVVIDCFYHPQARRDAEYLLNEHLR